MDYILDKTKQVLGYTVCICIVYIHNYTYCIIYIAQYYSCTFRDVYV